MESWDELEALVTDLREANADWAKSADALQQQLAGFRELTAQIDRHFSELGVYESLTALAGRALNDAARIHLSRLHYGLTRSAAMLWYPLDDPRAELAAAPPETLYSVEVRIGPRYLLGVERDAAGAGDQRMSIVIAGEKQLVATLPTTPEKFRGALLRAFANPSRSGPPQAAAGETAEPSAPEEGAAGEPPVEQAAPADGTTPPLGEPNGAVAGAQPAATEARTADDQGREAEGDDVIQLPGASTTPERKAPARRGRRSKA